MTDAVSLRRNQTNFKAQTAISCLSNCQKFEKHFNNKKYKMQTSFMIRNKYLSWVRFLNWQKKNMFANWN